MATEVKVSGGNSITVSVNENVLTSVTGEKNKIEVTQPAALAPVVSTTQAKVKVNVTPNPNNNISVTQQVVRSVEISSPVQNQVSVLGQGVKGDKGDQGLPGIDGVDGGGLISLFHDPSPKLGQALDVFTHSIFTTSVDGNITFTSSGTGSINLDGTVKFKRFAEGSEPQAFEGGMYADENDNLYFGVSDD